MSSAGKQAKKELIDSFAGFSTTTVSERNIHLARECIARISARSARYEIVPFTSIIQWNEVPVCVCVCVCVRACVRACV